MTRIKIFLALSIGVFGIAFIQSCFQAKATPSIKDLDFSKIPYENISDYGFFKGNLNELEAVEDLLLYAPVSSLFTDYAEKSRYIYLPEGATATIKDRDRNDIEFPDQTIIVKNFYYSEEYSSGSSEQRIMETRLLVKNDGKWNAYPYLWNDEQTEAPYKVTGANISASIKDTHGDVFEFNYIQPNKNQCKSCHNIDEQLMPIGPRTRNLNFDFDYGNGEVKNQLDKWNEKGWLSNYTQSSDYATMVDYNDVHADISDRGKAYLDMNCGHCHNAHSPASTSGLFMTYEETDSSKWGFWKTPIAAGKGSGFLDYDIYPGHADSSIIVYRMASVEPGIMMPEVGRSIVHTEGVDLVKEWINSIQ